MKRMVLLTMLVVAAMGVGVSFVAQASRVKNMSVSEMEKKADTILLAKVDKVVITEERHPTHNFLVKCIAHCTAHENYKGKPRHKLEVPFFRHAKDKVSSLRPLNLSETQNYILFLNDHDARYDLITEFDGVVDLGSFNASSSILFSADQVRELFNALKEKEIPNK